MLETVLTAIFALCTVVACACATVMAYDFVVGQLIAGRADAIRKRLRKP